MFRKIRLPLVSLAAMLILLVLPQVTLAAPQRRPSQPEIKNVAFTFAGSITQGIGSGTPLIGGLVLQINAGTGAFHGTFNSPGALPQNLLGRGGACCDSCSFIAPLVGDCTRPEQAAVRGIISSAGHITIAFFTSRDHNTFLIGGGSLNNINEYTGNFRMFNNGYPVAASGIWSALQVERPTNVTAYAYQAKVTSGPFLGLQLNAAMIVNKSGLGRANLPDGSVVPATFVRTGINVVLTFQISNGFLINGQGTIFDNNSFGTLTTNQGNGVFSAYHFNF